MRRVAQAITAVGVALLLAGCGDATSPTPSASPAAAGSAPPTPAPTTLRPTATASLVSPIPSASGTPSVSPTLEATMPDFTLTSTAFAGGGSVPRRFSCDGEDVSPELSWSGAPAGTAALALVVDDPDARGFVHWLVLDLPGADHGRLAEGVPPSAAEPHQGTNDFGRRGWGGPCPPSGEHRYTFTLYALGAPLGIAATPRARDVRAGSCPPTGVTAGP